MGNFASKEVPAEGADVDVYHSLPSSPVSPKYQGTPLPLAAAPKKSDSIKLRSPWGSFKERNPHIQNSSHTATPKNGTQPNQTGSNVDGGQSTPSSPALCPSSTSLSELGHADKAGGQKPLAAVGNGKRGGHEDRRENVSALRKLLMECRTSLDLSPMDDGDCQDETQGAADLLRCILEERGELVQEVQSLKETMETERAEWLQFQSDLQVAVSVADRLQLEAQEELEKLQGVQEEKERELATAREQQLEAERELETTRVELEETRWKLAALEDELKELRGGTQARTDLVAEGGSAMTTLTDGSERKEGSDSVTGASVGKGSVNTEPQVEGTGVVEASLQNPESEEKTREEGRNSPSGMRATEQTRSLSRLPLLSSPTSTMNGISQPAATLSPSSLCKNRNTTRGKKVDPALEGQESGSTDKQEEVESLNKHNAAPMDTPHKASKSQDGFSLLLRRHGGSKRNSLLRWCQSRTQGYKNIDITNFSSSWSDGLAFCAVYHTYLPSVIPYSSLCPADRRENLGLAFQTGERVGITASLVSLPAYKTVEEVLRRGGPDWQRVLGYVESIYRHFEM